MTLFEIVKKFAEKNNMKFKHQGDWQEIPNLLDLEAEAEKLNINDVDCFLSGHYQDIDCSHKDIDVDSLIDFFDKVKSSEIKIMV